LIFFRIASMDTGINQNNKLYWRGQPQNEGGGGGGGNDTDGDGVIGNSSGLNTDSLTDEVQQQQQNILGGGGGGGGFDAPGGLLHSFLLQQHQQEQLQQQRQLQQRHRQLLQQQQQLQELQQQQEALSSLSDSQLFAMSASSRGGNSNMNSMLLGGIEGVGGGNIMMDIPSYNINAPPGLVASELSNVQSNNDDSLFHNVSNLESLAHLWNNAATTSSSSPMVARAIRSSQMMPPAASHHGTNMLLPLGGRLMQQGSESSTWIGNMTGQGDVYAENGILGPWSARSAGLLGSMVIEGEEKDKKIRKKPKDKPKRPLSAYNIFFKEERSRILSVLPEGEETKETEGGGSGKGGGRKRKQKPHGKIGFESLAKIIGQRWQELRADQVSYYKQKAQQDTLRYKHEMEAYLFSNTTSTSTTTTSSLSLKASSSTPDKDALKSSNAAGLGGPTEDSDETSGDNDDMAAFQLQQFVKRQRFSDQKGGL
jgi:hypothetical protein